MTTSTSASLSAPASWSSPASWRHSPTFSIITRFLGQKFIKPNMLLIIFQFHPRKEIIGKQQDSMKNPDALRESNTEGNIENEDNSF